MTLGTYLNTVLSTIGWSRHSRIIQSQENRAAARRNPVTNQTPSELHDISRRRFLGCSAAALAALSFLPANALSEDLAHSELPVTTTRQSISRENIGKLAVDSLSKLQKLSPIRRTQESANIEWNNIITFLALSQEVDLPYVDEIREYVLKNGESDSSIPIPVLDAAISTVHDWANKITGTNAKERKGKVYELLKPYLGYYIANIGNGRVLTKNQPSSTEFIFPAHVNYAIAGVINPKELEDLPLNNDTQQIFTLHPDKKNLPSTIVNRIAKQCFQSTGFNIEEVHNSSDQDKFFHGNNILILALNSHNKAQELCEQWFDKRANQKSSPGDFVVLRAAAILAQKNDSSLDYLETIAKKFPNMFFHNAYFTAHESAYDGHDTAAGDEITKAFEKNPRRTKEFLISQIEESSKKDKTGAILSLGTMNDSSGTIDTLRIILGNKNYTNEEQVSAMVGISRAKDKESIPTLLDIACDNSLPKDIREKALIAIVLIDSKDPIPESFRKQYAKESPCGLDLSIVDDFLSGNKISDPLIKGQATLGVDITETVSGTIRSFTYKTTLSNGYLKELNESNNENLNTLANIYLRNQNGNLDLQLAIPVMKILSASKHEGAVKDLIKMSTHPESFIENTPKNNVYINLLSTTSKREPGANSILLRDFATLFLGNVANASASDDEAFKSLLITAKDDDPLFRDRAYRAINLMAQDFKEEKSPHFEDVLELTKLFIKEQSNAFTARKTDFREDFYNLFLLLDSTCKLGGVKEVFEIAQASPHLKRLIAHTYKLNNISSADLRRLNCDPFDIESIFSFLPREKNKEIQSVRIAIIDGGPVMQSDEVLQENISIPSRFTTHVKPESQFAAHANNVSKLIDQKITSYSYDNLYRRNPLKAIFLQDAGYMSMLDVLANNLTEGNIPFDLLSQSRGIKTRNLETKEGRKAVDFENSLFSFLNEVGVLCLNTPGNDGGSKHGNYSGVLGSFSPLGLRIRNRDEYEVPENVLHVNVSDPFNPNNGLAPFASRLKPHGTLKLHTIHHDGTCVLDWYNGKQVSTATSFALPLFVAELATLLSERRRMRHPDLSPAQLISLLTNHSTTPIAFNLNVAKDLLLTTTVSSR